MDFDKDREKASGPQRDRKPFDFDAFLDDDDLDERVTDALDGEDLLREDAFDQFAPDYIPPRRASDGEHGRHEAPGSEELDRDEPSWQRQPAENTPERPAGRFDPSDPRYAAPERPKVVAAEPRKRVYVTPPGSEDYDERDSREQRSDPPRRGMGEGVKWLIAVLVAAAVIIGLLAALFSGGSDDEDDADAAATPSGILTQAFETDTTSATPQPAATPSPTPTDAPVTAHRITVTYGSGGSVSPSGVVTVEDGASASFTITPDSGYETGQVLVDGEAVSIGAAYTFSNVTTDHTIYVVFQASATPSPTPTATPSPTPSPTPTPTEPPPADDDVTVTDPNQVSGSEAAG